MKSLAVLLALGAILQCTSAAGPSTRRLHNQATAIASSIAEASGGGKAVSDTRSQAVAEKQPATAVGQTVSKAGPGQTVVGQCDVYAKDSEQYKYCVGQLVGGSNLSTASSAALTWESAPTCPSTDTSAFKDGQGRLWGWDSSKSVSCVFKTADGKPVYGTGGTAAAGAVASAYFLNQTALNWETAPSCKGSVQNWVSKDSAGRLWGWENNTSCAFKDSVGNPLFPATPAGNATTASVAPSPTPSPTLSPSPAAGGGASAQATAAAAAKAQGGRRLASWHMHKRHRHNLHKLHHWN
jgi:hypothetical protein